MIQVAYPSALARSNALAEQNCTLSAIAPARMPLQHPRSRFPWAGLRLEPGNIDQNRGCAQAQCNPSADCQQTEADARVGLCTFRAGARNQHDVSQNLQAAGFRESLAAENAIPRTKKRRPQNKKRRPQNKKRHPKIKKRRPKSTSNQET